MVKRLSKKKTALLVIFLIPAVVTGMWLFADPMLGWRAEWTINKFKSNPCQKNAEAVAKLLDRRDLSKEQAEEVLPMLLGPEIITRSAYPLGQVPVIGIQQPFELHFPNRQCRFRILTWYGDSKPVLNKKTTKEITRTMQFLTLDELTQKKGLHKFTLSCDFVLMEPEDRPMPWLRRHKLTQRLYNALIRSRRRRREKPYRFHVNVIADIVMTEKDEAEQVTFISNPAIDEAIEWSFSYEVLNVSFEYWVGLNLYRTGGAIKISFKDITSNVAFKPLLELSDGRRIPEKLPRDKEIRVRAGNSFSFEVNPRNFCIDKPGQYNCTIVLIADPNIAYGHPSIKSIWGGELKFPIRFTIEEIP